MRWRGGIRTRLFSHNKQKTAAKLSGEEWRGGEKEERERGRLDTFFRTPHEIEGIFKRAFVGGGKGRKGRGKKRGNGSGPAEASTFKGAFAREEWERASEQEWQLRQADSESKVASEPGSYFPSRYEGRVAFGMGAPMLHSVECFEERAPTADRSRAIWLVLACPCRGRKITIGTVCLLHSTQKNRPSFIRERKKKFLQ